jgi:hypothetical protein
MNTHPYLRAYMAGIVVPTVVLLFVLSAFILARFVFALPVPIERAIVFPMGVVPNLFGMWNIFYLWLRPRRHLPIGFHGAILPFLLVPSGYVLGRALNILRAGSNGIVYFQAFTIPYAHLAIGFVVGVTLYYLVWKYFVGFFNRELGIA